MQNHLCWWQRQAITQQRRKNKLLSYGCFCSQSSEGEADTGLAVLVFCHVSLQGHCSGPLAKKDGSCVGGLVWPHVSIGDWAQCSWV